MPATKCRRCTECANSPHHWLPNSDFANDEAPEELRDFEWICKHCEVLGRDCGHCLGSGEDGLNDPQYCDRCDGYGVIAEG